MSLIFWGLISATFLVTLFLLFWLLPVAILTATVAGSDATPSTDNAGGRAPMNSVDNT